MLSVEGLSAALGSFLGPLQQLPPSYSALKVDGEAVAAEDVEAVVGKKLHLTYRTRGPLTGPALGLLGGGLSFLSPMERDALEGAGETSAGVEIGLQLGSRQS